MNLLRNNSRSGRGVALIIVMLVITVLVLIAGGFAYSMKVETTLARYSNSDVEFEWIARSGVEMARFAVGQQLKVPTEPYDSANQFWSGGRNITNEIFQDMTLDNVPIGRGTFSVKIVDQERKFNINAADDTVL
ncbi:MAG: general secretion pathway protein GspK, partial [Verrucomicrobia bacterium]|nr:general secretion pathway protein GspK [Verrucomicrobiota bacterium]